MSYFQVIHTALLIEGEVKERYRLKPEEIAQGKTAPYGFKIKKITLLGNVASTMIHGFTIEITTPMLSDAFRKSLVSVIRSNQGNIPLNMKLYDPQKGYTIDFVSNKFRVNVNTGFVDQLKELDIKYAVN
jgi:DNA polymerase-3 subunit alpha